MVPQIYVDIWLWSLPWFPQVAFIVTYVITNNLNKWNYWFSKNSGTIANIFYKWTNTKSFDSISLTWKYGLQHRGPDFCACSLLLRSSYVYFLLKEMGSTWKFDLSGLRAHLRACFLLPISLDVSFSLKEKVLTWGVDLRGRGHDCVCLFSSLGIFNRFLLF